MIGLLAGILLVATPPQAYSFAYRFEKGLSYVDAQQRTMTTEIYANGKQMRWKAMFESRVKRTILSVDETAHPSAERVEVERFRVIMKENPEQEKLGEKPLPCEGKSFVWRRLEKRWGLFLNDRDVTDGHKELVDQLKNWRDARLPRGPVTVGQEWQVPPQDFMETAGLKVPKGLEGVAAFKLDGVEGAVAEISFEFRFSSRQGGGRQTGVERGRWRFDHEKGRDLSFEMEGTIQVDGGRGGKGEIAMVRTVTYPEPPPERSSGPSDRGS